MNSATSEWRYSADVNWSQSENFAWRKRLSFYYLREYPFTAERLNIIYAWVACMRVGACASTHPHILTYLLTPWGRVLLEKLTGCAAIQEIPRIFGTRRFITILTSARHLSLSWANSIQSPQTPPTSWRSILIQGGSNMTGTDFYVNKPHCAAAVRSSHCDQIPRWRKRPVRWNSPQTPTTVWGRVSP